MTDPGNFIKLKNKLVKRRLERKNLMSLEIFKSLKMNFQQMAPQPLNKFKFGDNFEVEI